MQKIHLTAAPLKTSLHVLQEATVALSRCPLIANPPPLIMDSRNLTLLDLGSRSYLPSSDLPPACQVRLLEAAAL